jgi:hypothetical protein
MINPALINPGSIVIVGGSNDVRKPGRKVLSKTKTEIVAESVVYNSEGKEIGRGNGIFVRGKQSLVDILSYSEASKLLKP